MPFKHHPTEALILSVLNGTADVVESRTVSEHVAVCARCSIVSERQGLLLRELSEYNQLSVHSTKAQESSKIRSFPRSWSLKPRAYKFAGGAVAAALFIMVFAWPRHIQTVSAAELLSRAEAAQDSADSTQHFYRFNVAGATCNTADATWSKSRGDSDVCGRVHSRLAETHWDDRHVLSARSFRQWHDALSRKRDSVVHKEHSWTLQTDTDQGILRSARLRVRSSDYRPVELTLEFTALESVSVVEGVSTERRVYVPAAQPEMSTKAENLQHVDQPEDQIEVEAWKLLRTLGGDSGWEATITRNGRAVRVVGFIGDERRRDSFKEAFSHLQGVTTDLERPEVLPKRGADGDGHPLAEEELEELIPDSHERGVRVTEITDGSRAVVGKAFLYDQLMSRGNTLQGAPSGQALTPLIDEERADLIAATTRLSDLLEPLLKQTQSRVSRVPLNYAQARQLDAAVLSLVNAAPRQAASLLETQAHIGSLLSKR